MPSYPYRCSKCENKFDVIKSISAIDTAESCTNCYSIADRCIGLVNFNGAADWSGSYNPAFGCYVRSKVHQREILAELKDKGREMVEVGTEPVEKIHKHYDNQRDKIRADRWNESAEQVIKETLR